LPPPRSSNKPYLKASAFGNNVNAALKQQLINSVGNIYIHTLPDCHTGFANVSTQELMERLLRAYGNSTPTDLAENDI
jgi:hypothetical protein